MPISFIGANTGKGSTVGVTFDDLLADVPDIVLDDFLVLVIEGEGEDASADGVPAGWTTVASAASATTGLDDDTRATVAWARYSTTLSLAVPDAGDHVVARIYVFRGVGNTANIEAFTSGSNAVAATSHTVVTALTTLADGAMVVLGLAVGDDVTVTSPANASLASCSSGGSFLTTSGSDGTVAALYGIKTTAGGAGSFTFTTSTSESIAWVALSLEPAVHNPRVDAAHIEVISEGTVNPRVDAAHIQVVATNKRNPQVEAVFIEVVSLLGLQLDFIDEDEMYEPTASSVAVEDNVYLRESGAEPAYFELESRADDFLALESAANPPNELLLDFIDEDATYEPVMTKGPSTQITLDFIDEDAMYEPAMTLTIGSSVTLDFIDDDEMYEPTTAGGVTSYVTLDFIDDDEMWEINFTTPSFPAPVPREPGARRYPAGGGFDDPRSRGFRPVSGGTTVRGHSGR